MCISAKTVFLLSFLIFNILIIPRLESAKLHNPNEPASSKFISSLCRGWYGQVDNIAFLAKQLEPSAVIRIAEESTSDLYDLIEKKLMQQVEKKITHGYGNPNREVYDPTSVKYIAPVDYDKVDFYQPVDEKKKEKDEKTGKEKAITVTESYQPTTSVYVPTITAKYIAPVSTPYSIPSTTVKHILPPVTRPYSTKKTAVKYTKTYVPTKTEKPTTTTMMPYMPDVSEYDSINSVNIPEGPEGSLLADNYYPSPEEDEEDEDYI